MQLNVDIWTCALQSGCHRDCVFFMLVVACRLCVHVCICLCVLCVLCVVCVFRVCFVCVFVCLCVCCVGVGVSCRPSVFVSV